MKKFLTAILAVLYITTSTGATIHMHYCMGKLADWGLGDKESKSCAKCGMKTTAKKDKGCCRDEHKFVKNNSDQKVSEASFQMGQQLAVTLPVSFIEIPSIDFHSITEENPSSNAPPISGNTAIYIRNCNFRL